MLIVFKSFFKLDLLGASDFEALVDLIVEAFLFGAFCVSSDFGGAAMISLRRSGTVSRVDKS
jgi:hypothetical protein